MMRMCRVIGVALLALWCFTLTLPHTAQAQQLVLTPPAEQAVREANAARQRVNDRGMWVLLGWGALNMAAGSAGWAVSDDARWRGFHQMNAMWNVVNTGIAVGSLLSDDAAPPGLSGAVGELRGMQNLLLFNAGLDVGYMAMGGLLWERGLRRDSDRMVGWGQSMILQGAFLMAFDLVLWWSQRHIERALWDALE